MTAFESSTIPMVSLGLATVVATALWFTGDRVAAGQVAQQAAEQCSIAARDAPGQGRRAADAALAIGSLVERASVDVADEVDQVSCTVSGHSFSLPVPFGLDRVTRTVRLTKAR